MGSEPQASSALAAVPAAPIDDTTCVGEVEDYYVKRHLYSEEVRARWNIAKIVRELGTREQGLQFAIEHGLVRGSKECRKHRKLMKIEYSTNRTVGAFVCNKGNCRATSRISRAKGTWFEGTKLTLPQIYYLMYAYAYSYSYDHAIHEDLTRDELEQCLSRVTICNWYCYCRETVVLYHLYKDQSTAKIGGPGKTVQIDQCKFGKRKFNKGRHIEDNWLLGMVEDGSEDLRLEVCPEDVQSADDLIHLIQKHVAEGTVVHTDFWSVYNCLSECGYIHKKFNYNETEGGTHNKQNSSQWKAIKKHYGKNNYLHSTSFADLIVEYLWRRNVQRKKEDPFVALIRAIKHTYKV